MEINFNVLFWFGLIVGIAIGVAGTLLIQLAIDHIHIVIK